MSRSSALCALGASLMMGSCKAAPSAREDQPAVEVRCVPASERALSVAIVLRGRVAAPPGADVAIAAQTPGRVVSLNVHEGDRIAQGSVVASVDSAPSVDALRQADAALVQAKASAANADATLVRTRELVTRGIAAKQELDDAVSRSDQAHAGVSSALAASDLAARALGRVQVRSAFAGTVTRIWRGVGALVDGSAQTPIAQVAATDLEELDADATDQDLQVIAIGQAAQIDLASGQSRGGVVLARSSSLDPSTGLGLVRIALAKGESTLLLGEYATAHVALPPRNVLTVPGAAIRGAQADGAEVVVCKDGKAALRRVAIGQRDDAGVEVKSGLTAGEEVAVDHVLGLDTGSAIVTPPRAP